MMTNDSINLQNFMNEDYLVLAILTMVILSLLLCIIYYSKHKNKRLKEKFKVTEMILKPLSEEGLDKQLNAVLEVVISAIQADGYYFYIFNHQSGNYNLRVSRHNKCNYQVIHADYSGLAPYDQPMYSSPLGINGPRKEKSIEIIKDKHISMLEISLDSGEGLIRIGPVQRIAASKFRLLEELSLRLGSVVHLLLAFDHLKNDVEKVKHTNAMISELNQTVFTVDQVTKNIMTVVSRILESGGCCLVKKIGDRWDIPLFTKMTEEAEQQFRQDNDVLNTLFLFLEKKNSCLITPDSKEFYGIPYYLLALGIQSLFITKIENNRFKGMTIFWFANIPHMNKTQESFAQMMTKRLGEIWDQQEAYEVRSSSYIQSLRTIIEMTDNLEPYTVGHSELVVRYAVTIAKQMSLPSDHIENVKLAAYFHDIGMLSLERELSHKYGKFSLIEYETMKIHTEVGAAIIESGIANHIVASYIRHHHERWDGLGYPRGLKESQIPLGSRIIAVADFFTAKIQGRKYRDPVSFEQAITDLQAVSGTQLDPEVVETLLSWFKRKQTNPARSGKSLGSCWEMRCCPAHIHSYCPAFTQKSNNCWEIEGVNCALHGNSCETCIVRTEVIYRDDKYYSPLKNMTAS